MKADISTKIYRKIFLYDENHQLVNKTVKAVILSFGGKRGDVIVENDNFGTRRKYADFTEGKRKAGLHPLQIVFSGVDHEIICKTKYIGADDKIHVFGEDDVFARA